MRIKVRLFASLRERMGQGLLEMELPLSSTVAAFLDTFNTLHPRVCPKGLALMVAVNEEYADPSVVLKEGDEIALIPPVSGGLV